MLVHSLLAVELLRTRGREGEIQTNGRQDVDGVDGVDGCGWSLLQESK